MPDSPEVWVALDAIDETLLGTIAAQQGLTREQLAERLIADGLQQMAEDAVQVTLAPDSEPGPLS